MENDPVTKDLNQPSQASDEQLKTSSDNGFTMSQPVSTTESRGLDVPESEHNTSGHIILQWLTYAFWLLTVIAMSILTVTVLANYITGFDTGDFTPYSVAAVIVLLPVALICDIFYSKHEPLKKTGPASIVMVIHAVIFALSAASSIITVVFSLITIILNSSTTVSKSTTVTFYSSIVIAVLFLATLFRTIRPVKMLWINRTFIIFMTAIVGIFCILAFAGPIHNASLTKNDKLIAANISSLYTAVNDYSHKNSRLPDSLNVLSLSGDTKQLVDKNLVTYKQDSTPPDASADTVNQIDLNTTTGVGATSAAKVYYFQLCVDYVKESSNIYKNSYSSSVGDEYNTYVDAYYHPAGNFCYKLKTNSY